ncbi:uncharacterized protein LOC101887569 [Musca domestica]|uniref:Uncharacterized protein LOC101887569 n=1 Tax=Musca domestica TaxID=7370 RepID=A0A1I8MKX4_MUSDO|nr:uncharacterized protein LOC101887569 [Musca domestica]
MENKENIITADLLLQQGLRNISTEVQQPPCKRRQTKALFRPWEENVQTSKINSKLQEKKSKVLQAQQNIRNISNQNASNLRFILEQPKYNPYNLITSANNQMEQQYLQQFYMAQQQQQYAIWMEQAYRTNLYLRHLQQIALQRQQQQLFVFGLPR